MEVHFTPEVQARFERMAREAGRRSSEIVEEVVAGFLDDFADTQGTLDRRYDEMESGKAQGIDGEEVFRRLREKTEARRQRRLA